MLFSEVYSIYYKTVAEIIRKAIESPIDTKTIINIVENNAFSESNTSIPEALKTADWPFIKDDKTSVLENPPHTPLTNLEKRWLKTLLSDEKIQLFDIDTSFLNDVEPLYDKEVFVYFDVFEDGDNFSDENYIYNFKTILSAIKTQTKVLIKFSDKQGSLYEKICVVDKLEYSAKNDRFRLLALCDGVALTINMSNVIFCELTNEKNDINLSDIIRVKKELIAEVSDVANTLERALISFSYLEKETIKIDDTNYVLKLRYFAEDEAELLIQILSFSDNIKVISPDDFTDKLKARIKKQKELFKNI